TAKVVTLAPPPSRAREEGPDQFTPASYVWSFGDGEAATTTAPLVTHSYESRAQETLYSYFAVAVEARDKTGEKLSARTTLSLINPAFEAFAYKGIVMLLVELDPRFPELGADGRVVQRVRLRHTRPEHVTIKRATLMKYFESGAGQAGPEAIE